MLFGNKSDIYLQWSRKNNPALFLLQECIFLFKIKDAVFWKS